MAKHYSNPMTQIQARLDVIMSLSKKNQQFDLYIYCF